MKKSERATHAFEHNNAHICVTKQNMWNKELSNDDAWHTVYVGAIPKFLCTSEFKAKGESLPKKETKRQPKTMTLQRETL